MALQYLFDPNKQFQSRNGVNAVNGFLRVYLNGTDDRATTYRNFDGGLNEPDIVLDTDGRAVVIVDGTKTYRMEVYDADGSLMWTVTNYKARGGSGGSGTPVSVEGTAGEIDVDVNEVGGVKHFIVSLASIIKNALSSLQSAVNGLALSLGNKKERQTPKEFFGSTTKTVVGVSQNENGEMDVNFEDIEFPDYSQRFEKIENEQNVDAKVIAAALNDLNARLDALESEGDNIGDVKADSLDAQNLFVGGVKVKFQQAVKSFDGATNKTVTNISQNENGEMTVTYSPISFPDWTSAITAATDLCEKLANKKTTFSGFETSDTFYPTLKAVVDYLDGRLQNLGGKKITNNGQPFTAVSQLPTTTPYYGQNINSDDYAFVQDTGLASRYTAIVSGSSVSWSIDYEIALPVFTAEQQDAIDSGVNSTKVGNYDAHIANTSNPHGVTYSQVGASPDTHTHQVVINGVTKTIDKTGGTPVDLGTYLTSHQDLSGYLSKTGDGSDVTASFATAGSRNNISTGEKLSVIFGKIAKWFTDLKALAFRDTIGTAQIENDSVTAAKVKDNETLPVHISGIAESAKRFNNEVGTSGVDGHRAIFGGIDSENNAKISMSEKTGGVSKSTEITPSGITTTGGMIIGGDIIIGGSNPATDVKDNSNLAVLIASKANKASSGNGNLAVIDSNGNYASSGIGAYAQSQLNSAITNSVVPWLTNNSYIVTRSFWIQSNTSVIGRAIDFVNSYTGENLLRIGVSYDYTNGEIFFYLPWSNASWNGWIIENPDPQSSAEVGGAIITANGTKHSSNSSSDTITPFHKHIAETIHSNNVSQTAIGTFDVGKSIMYDTSSYYDFVITLFNGLSSKMATLKISMAIDRYVSGNVKANIIGMATIDASGLNT